MEKQYGNDKIRDGNNEEFIISKIHKKLAMKPRKVFVLGIWKKPSVAWRWCWSIQQEKKKPEDQKG